MPPLCGLDGTAAHELGHLLLHGDAAPGDVIQEKEADAFAAEFLTPAEVIGPELPVRMDLKALERLARSGAYQSTRSSIAAGR